MLKCLHGNSNRNAKRINKHCTYIKYKIINNQVKKNIQQNLKLKYDHRNLKLIV